LQFDTPLVPDKNIAGTEGLFLDISRSDSFQRKNFSFDRQAPFAISEWRFLEERPGTQLVILNNSQVKMCSAGFVSMNNES
jgi:hypothetical protein